MTDTATAQPTLNVELLRQVVTQITEHPETHDQSVYENCRRDGDGNLCRTVFCVAGWAAYLSGWKPPLHGDTWAHPDGSSTDDPGLLAQELLGITGDQAWGGLGSMYGLFSGGQDLDRVVAQADRIAAEAGATL